MATITVDGIKYELKEANGVKYYRDWERTEGGICVVGAKTLKRYHQLTSEHPDSEKYGIFFAFGTDRFEEGKAMLIRKGYIKEGDKIVSAGMGMYGTRAEIDRYLKFYDERHERIAKECNPQEVYFSEWNNHECMFTNDDEALKCIVSTFGKETAHKIVRVCPGTPTNVLAPLTTRDEHLQQYEHQLMMLGRFDFDLDGFFSEGDCRHNRPDCLWGGSIQRFMQEVRKTYDELPDDIKDASCLSKEQIEQYAKRLIKWADEEFEKPEYNPVPHTPSCVYAELDCEIDGRLLYKDDDGKWQQPDHIWFSHDSRRCHQNADEVHGRAFTSYLGKHGTTLARVYISNWRSLNYVPYRRDDLCDVSCRYKYEPLHNRLYDFHHE